MWLCEGKFKVKIAHFRLPSASQKRACLSFLICNGSVQFQIKPRSIDDAELDHLTLFLQWTAKKCTKIYKARAQLMFCSLNLLFSDVLAAVVVLACLSSLLTESNPFYHHIVIKHVKSLARRK